MASSTVMVVMVTAVNRARFGALLPVSYVVSGALLPIGLSLTEVAWAETWQFNPGLRGVVTYSDNVALSARGNEVKDTSYEIVPSVNYSRKDGRVEITADYSLDHVFHSNDRAGSRNVNTLNSVAKLEPVDNIFYVDANAQISQQSISALSAQTASNAALTSNRTNVTTFSLSPYFKGVFGQGNQFEFRYRYGDTFSDSNVNDTGSISRALSGVIRGGSLQSRWSLSMQRSETLATGNAVNRTKDGSRLSMDEYIQGNLTWMLDNQVSLGTNLGYQHTKNYSTGLPYDLIYGLDVNWKPTTQTVLSMSANHRATGPAYNYSVSHKTGWTAWNLTWDRSVTTNQTLLLASNPVYDLFSDLVNRLYSDPAQQKAMLKLLGVPQGYVADIGLMSNQMIMQNSFKGSVAMVGVRNTVTLNVGRSSNNSITSFGGQDDFNQYSLVRQNSWGLTWNLLVSPVTRFTVSYNRLRNEGVSGNGVTTLRQGTLTSEISSQFSPKMTGSIALRNYFSDGGQTGLVRENAVIGTVGYRF